MTRGKCTFRESDLSRAVRAARKAGVEVARIEIGCDGKIAIVTAKAGETCNGEPKDGEVERWLGKHAHPT